MIYTIKNGLLGQNRLSRQRIMGIFLCASLMVPSYGMEYLKPLVRRAGTFVANHKTMVAIAGACALAGGLCYATRDEKPLAWQWDAINYEQPQNFPAQFLWGTATSAHQVEGNCTNNTWSRWEQEVGIDGIKRVESPSGLACDQWNRYAHDIQLMKHLGVNAYRFSVEWSKIEPEEGVFDEAALRHYEAVCQELVDNGIRPCITLHHYTDPLWFLAKNGFEKEENIACYVRFATTVIKRLHRFNPLWFTFNSPDGYAAQGYITCTKPAGRIPLKRDMQLFAQVYKNLLDAHVQTYRAIKNAPAFADASIGILKNIFQLDACSPYSFWDRFACGMSKRLVDAPFFDYFSKGRFDLYVPFKVTLHCGNAAAHGALDFVGINYYSHGCMKNFSITTHAKEEATDNPRYTIYAEGLYRAIAEMADKVARPLGIPMYITENGIATTDDAKRDRFIKKYLCALSRAVNDGYDVRGYFHWSFMDNYEWGSYKPKYGLYHVDFATQERTLKPGSQFYRDTIMHKIG